MAHTAELRLEGRTYKIITCEYKFAQPLDEIGQPCAHPMGGLVHLTIESPDNSDLFIHNWMLNATDHKDGTIAFTVVSAGKPTTKILNFKRAYCVGLYECFDSGADAQMLTEIAISAAEISFGIGGNAVFKNDEK